MTVYTGAPTTLVAGDTSALVTKFNDHRDALKALTEASGTYTPTWSTSAGSPAVNNGTLTGRYSQSGKWVDGIIELVVGTTTTFGTAGSSWRFTLPVTPRSSQRHRWLGSAVNTGTADYPAFFRWNSAGYCEVMCHPTTAGNPDRTVTDTVPFTWGSTDVLMVQFRYEAA